MEARNHFLILKVISQSQDNHPLMMSIIGVYDSMLLPKGEVRFCIVNGFIEAIQSHHVKLLKFSDILHHCLWL